MTAINEISLQSVKEILKEQSKEKELTYLSGDPLKTKYNLNKAVMLNKENAFTVELILQLRGQLHRITTPILAVSENSVTIGNDIQIPLNIIVNIDFP